MVKFPLLFTIQALTLIPIFVGFSTGWASFSGSAGLRAGRFPGDINHMFVPAAARALPVNGESGCFQTFFKGLVRIFGPNSKHPAGRQGGTA
jgi:hypothetical protein